MGLYSQLSFTDIGGSHPTTQLEGGIIEDTELSVTPAVEQVLVDFKHLYEGLALGNLKGKVRADLAMQLLHYAADNYYLDEGIEDDSQEEE